VLRRAHEHDALHERSGVKIEELSSAFSVFGSAVSRREELGCLVPEAQPAVDDGELREQPP